jgi:hypothetical protein
VTFLVPLNLVCSDRVDSFVLDFNKVARAANHTERGPMEMHSTRQHACELIESFLKLQTNTEEQEAETELFRILSVSAISSSLSLIE